MLTPALARQLLAYGTRYPHYEDELAHPCEKVQRFADQMSAGHVSAVS